MSEALHAWVRAEELDEYRDEYSGVLGRASKSTRLERAPPLLILQLMRFDYAPGPTGEFAEYKITRKIKTEERFRLPGGWVSDTSPDVGAGYRLVATVTHHGAKMAAGHYTADVCREGTWLRFDDESVGVVEVDEVLGGEAYLLFYRRE